MRLFIEFTNLDMWEIIESQDYVPTFEQPIPSVATDPDQPAPAVVNVLPRHQQTDQYKTKVYMNAKAKYLLTYALSKSEYDKIISCDSAKEIWDRLQTPNSS